MSVEVRPLGVVCNLQCHYCYQNPQRDAGNAKAHYDVDAMLAALDKENSPFSIFGGEPLLVPREDLERLWEYGLRRFQRNAIQSNGTLIDAAFIELFKKYKVHVGLSIDGPADLNEARWAGTPERTRDQTARSLRAIDALLEAGMTPSLIVTLSRANATKEKIVALGEWICQQARRGINSIRLHLLEVDDALVRKRYALSADENIAALLYLRALEPSMGTRFDVFDDIEKLLLGRDDRVTCVWGACDPYTTSAVRGIEGHGQRSNCGRTNKDGVDFIKSNRIGHERQLALYATPQDQNGCRDCRFFLMCKGQCPGTAVDNDWRNRSEHCRVWFALFEETERDLVRRGLRPLSLQPQTRRQLEDGMIRAWVAGRNSSIASLLHLSGSRPFQASSR